MKEFDNAWDDVPPDWLAGRFGVKSMLGVEADAIYPDQKHNCGSGNMPSHDEPDEYHDVEAPSITSS